MRRAQHASQHGHTPSLVCFNPRPTHAPGATTPASVSEWRNGSFNPRPTHAPGATFRNVRRTLPTEVSILARRMRRAQPLKPRSPDTFMRVSILARRMRRAQPLKPRSPDTFMRVSILARRMRRAQRGLAAALRPRDEFQSSPDACAGRNHHRSSHHAPNPQFQSSPDACAGRNVHLARQWLIGSSFNPRPTHAPGATRNRGTRMNPRAEFQSSPDACAGRNDAAAFYR